MQGRENKNPDQKHKTFADLYGILDTDTTEEEIEAAEYRLKWPEDDWG
jgi:hypothetical protein